MLRQMLSCSVTPPAVPTRRQSVVTCSSTTCSPGTTADLVTQPSSFFLHLSLSYHQRSGSRTPRAIEQKFSPLAMKASGAAAGVSVVVAMATDSTVVPQGGGATGLTQLSAFLGGEGAKVEADLAVVIDHIQGACKRIASLLASPTALPLSPSEEQMIKGSGGTTADVGRDIPKPLDLVSNSIIKEALQASGKVSALASEEDDEAVWFGDAPYVVVFDPLDGSRNIDASIPTGTIFGIYKSLTETSGSPEAKANQNVLQPGTSLVASGYALYSSATMLCLTVGDGSHGFTLDRVQDEFVLTHPNLTIPERGQIYSLNDARYFDWPQGLKRYIDTIRQGKGQFPKKYSARYICSLVADLHRTVLYGGIAANPRSHLRLVYEANPLSFLSEQAGGKGSDGKRRILDIEPTKLHERLPVFLGSTLDIEELESYGDVQQVVNPGYNL